MASPDPFGAKGPTRRPRGERPRPREVRAPAGTDSAKALVMAHIDRLVARGLAEWDMLEAGNIRLRFHTGETFLLEDAVITRLA